MKYLPARKILVVIISILILLFSHRIYANYLKMVPISNYVKVLKTNSFNFKLNSFGIYRNGTSTILATKQLSENKILVFTTDRVSNVVSKYIYSQDSDLVDTLKLDSVIDLGSNKASLYIFDLLIDQNYLYVSLVEVPNSDKDCDVFRILKIPMLYESSDPSEHFFWKSDSCIKSFPKDPGWFNYQGRLAASNNYIYMTAGLVIAATADGYYPNPNLSNLDSSLENEIEKDQLFGGIIRVNKKNGVGERIAKGFRGPSGIVVTGSKTSERIFIADHGPRGGDELNLLIENKDYGWPNVSYGIPYSDFKQIGKNYIDTNYGSHEGFEKPIYYWSPSIGPSQIVVLKENLDSLNSFARGDLILGSLKAHSIFRIKVNSLNSVMSVEQVEIGARLRDISIENKKIFLSTDDGRIIVLKVDNSVDEGQFPKEKQEKYFYEENFILGKLTNIFDKGIRFLSSKFKEFK